MMRLIFQALALVVFSLACHASVAATPPTTAPAVLPQVSTQPTVLYGPNGQILGGPTNPLPTTDPNNAAYSTFGATFSVGTTVTAGHAPYANCSAAGSLTLIGAGGGSLIFPVGVGGQVFPFAVTQVSASTATCTYQNIN